jgi:hypothetical protein
MKGNNVISIASKDGLADKKERVPLQKEYSTKDSAYQLYDAAPFHFSQNIL